jgi:hypothetical protein
MTRRPSRERRLSGGAQGRQSGNERFDARWVYGVGPVAANLKVGANDEGIGGGIELS